MNSSGSNNSLVYHGGSPRNCCFPRKYNGGTHYEYFKLYYWGTTSMNYERPLYQGASHLQSTNPSTPDPSTLPYEGMDCQTLCPFPPHDDGKLVSLTLSMSRAATRSDLPVEYPCYAGLVIYRTNLDEQLPNAGDRARSILAWLKIPIPEPPAGSGLKVANNSEIMNSMLLPGDGSTGGRYQLNNLDIPVKAGWYLGASLMAPEWLPTEKCRSLCQDLNIYHEWDELYKSFIYKYHNTMLSFKFKPDNQE